MNELEKKIKFYQSSTIRNRAILMFIAYMMTRFRNYSANNIIAREGKLIKQIIFLDEYDYIQLTIGQSFRYHLSFENGFEKKLKENRTYQLGEYINLVTVGTSFKKFYEEFDELFLHPKGAINIVFDGMSNKQKVAMFALLRISDVLNADHSLKNDELRVLKYLKVRNKKE